jgi:hypothetical protein
LLQLEGIKTEDVGSEVLWTLGWIRRVADLQFTRGRV